MSEGSFFSFLRMQVWPRRLEPPLPKKGFQAREANRANQAMAIVMLEDGRIIIDGVIGVAMGDWLEGNTS